MNYGKCFLFVCDSTDLQKQLQTSPYQITLYNGSQVVGSVTQKWELEFSDMVAHFDKLGLVKSTTTEGVFGSLFCMVLTILFF